MLKNNAKKKEAFKINLEGSSNHSHNVLYNDYQDYHIIKTIYPIKIYYIKYTKYSLQIIE